MAEKDQTNESSGSLRSVSEGAGLFFIGKVISQGLSFLTNLILTRTLGANLYGTFAYLSVIFSLVYTLTTLGGDTSIQRFLPEHEEDKQTRDVFLTIAYLTSFIVSIVVAINIYLFAPLISAVTINEPLFVDVLRLGALIIPFNTLANITLSSFKAIERMDYNVAISSVTKPLLRLVFVGGAVLLGYSVIGAVAGLVVTSILTLFFSLLLLVRKTNLGQPQSPTIITTKKYYNFSVPLTFNGIGRYLYKRVDVLLVGLLLSGYAVGIYNIAILIAGVISLPLKAFNQLFPPIASKLYQNNQYSELQELYSVVTRWIFTISLFPGIAAILYSKEVLRIFGEEFPEGSLVLILFIIAQLTSAIAGPVGYLLIMSDHQYINMCNQLISGVANAVLNYIFILEYGFIGAALATASILAGINLIQVVQVWYLEGFNPYNRNYFKPVAAGISSCIIMCFIEILFSSYALLIVGGVAGGITFFAVLLSFGFEKEELDLIKEAIGSK